MERRALSVVSGRPKTTTVRFDDSAADRQAHAAALSLGTKESIENLVGIFRGQASAGVAHRDRHITGFNSRFDRQHAAGFVHTLKRLHSRP